jgi:hypothetical protein
MLKRTVWAIVLLLVLAGASFLSEGECARIRAEAAQLAVPICLPVDLSHPGVYRGKYCKNFAANHGDYLRLEVQPAFLSHEEMNKALTGLLARIVVTDETGEQVQDTKVDAETLEHEDGPPGTGSPRTIGLGIRKTGTYDVEFHVIHTAVGMNGRPQCLVGKYLFCGMEFMPALLLRAIGVGCWIAAGAIGLVTWAIVVSRQAASQAPAQDTARPAQSEQL